MFIKKKVYLKYIKKFIVYLGHKLVFPLKENFDGEKLIWNSIYLFTISEFVSLEY